MATISSKTIKTEKKYTKLLNNLLGVKGQRDQTIFTKVNNIDCFDISSKFSEKISEKILTQKQFVVQLVETDLTKLINLIKKTDNPNLIIKAFLDYKQKIFNTKKNLLMDETTFEDTKQKLLDELEEKKQKEKIRWKQYRRKVLDLNIQDNVWPLHVATMFICLKTAKKEFYAPLLLKEVELDINDDLVYLKT